MTFLPRTVTALAFALLSTTAWADITVENAWVRATAGTGKVSAGYGVLVNSGPGDDQLLSVATTAAGMTELHQSKEADGVMSMEAVKALTVPAGGRIEMKPGGYHLMMMNVAQPLKAGDAVTLTFTFKSNGTVTATAKVLPLATAAFE